MDKNISIALKIVGFVLIIIGTFIPLYEVAFDAVSLSGEFSDSEGLIFQLFGARLDVQQLTFIGIDTEGNTINEVQALFRPTQMASAVVLLSAALWFLIVFAVLFAILGQVFQSGGFRERGIFSDITAAILLLGALIVSIVAMNNGFNIISEDYRMRVDGNQAFSLNPITFNPNEENPAYFNLTFIGKFAPGFYVYIIGILMVVTSLFLPIDWEKPTSSTKLRGLGETKVFQKIKNILTMRLSVYITRRLLTLIPLFIAICVMTYVMVNGMGDPVALILLGKPRATEQDKINITRSLGLDQPVYARFVLWFYKLLHFDMGNSYRSERPINEMIGELIWETLKLQLASFFFALLIAIPLGVWAAKNQNTWIDSFSSTIALLGLSMPIFVFGLILIFIFSGLGLGWLPAAKAHRVPTPVVITGEGFNIWWVTFWERSLDSILHMVLPTIALTFTFLALYTRLVRSTMLEVLRQDYILSARANGLSERTITWKHAFRNVLIPIVTYVGLFLAFALAGAPITETLFTWPGLGYRYVLAIGYLDFPMILGVTAVLTILILIGNLITDIVYVAVDPRIEL